jgi:hypothetical protein
METITPQINVRKLKKNVEKKKMINTYDGMKFFQG